ncbi:hypothetical protein [Nocardia yamanashiensis]|uniref:hypothetical protein n=1 Tax=Nocardia yamanashiensis TaxID=209247 RepID=UPI000836B38B|nr:hypothetical protein [Nocardia yamanashiensis]
MANKRPVNRVTSQRRPAAQRSSGRVGGNTARPAARPAETTAPAGKGAKVRMSKDTARPAPRTESAASSASFWQTWRVAIGCGIAAVALAVLAIVGFLRPGVDDGNLAYVDNSATDEVKAAAQHALTTLYGYKAKEIDKFKDNARTVLTGQMLADLDKYADTGLDVIKQTDTDTQVTTDPLGVTLLTDDRAELLVNLNISAVKNGSPQALASGPIVLRMQKVDGKWLASEIADK